MTTGDAAALRIAVFGASGQLGAPFIAASLRAGCHITAFSRDPHGDEPSLRWRRARLPDAVPAIADVDAIVSLGPLDLFSRWLAAAPPRGVRRIVAIGSMSAETKAASAHADERALAARLCAAEERVARACDAAAIAWTVLRPTMLYGRGRDRNVSALMRRAQRWRVLPIPRARGLRQPLHVDDLAAAAFAALPVAASHGRILAIGGGERLSVEAMFRRIVAALPFRVLTPPLPAPAIRLAARAASRSRVAAALARFDRDLVADNAAVEAVLGVHPRPFAPAWPLPIDDRGAGIIAD